MNNSTETGDINERAYGLPPLVMHFQGLGSGSVSHIAYLVDLTRVDCVCASSASWIKNE